MLLINCVKLEEVASRTRHHLILQLCLLRDDTRLKLRWWAFKMLEWTEEATNSRTAPWLKKKVWRSSIQANMRDALQQLEPLERLSLANSRPYFSRIWLTAASGLHFYYRSPGSAIWAIPWAFLMLMAFCEAVRFSNSSETGWRVFRFLSPRCAELRWTLPQVQALIWTVFLRNAFVLSYYASSLEISDASFN